MPLSTSSTLGPVGAPLEDFAFYVWHLSHARPQTRSEDGYELWMTGHGDGRVSAHVLWYRPDGEGANEEVAETIWLGPPAEVAAQVKAAVAAHRALRAHQGPPQ